jgi:hypothetical protein
MKKTEYKISHQYQPTNTTCSPTALSMLLGAYGKEVSVAEISDKVPQVYNDKKEPQGTINQQMATWCLSLGFGVSLYTFDCQVIDLSWTDLDNGKLLERLKARREGWVVPQMGEVWTKAYADAYVDFIEAGGELTIQPAVTSALLYDLLQRGPILPCLCYNTLYGIGRTKNINEHKSADDDVNGRSTNHSIVIYGNDEGGNFLIADPYMKPGLHVVEPERLIAAISTAQIECDNLLFRLSGAKAIIADV